MEFSEFLAQHGLSVDDAVAEAVQARREIIEAEKEAVDLPPLLDECGNRVSGIVPGMKWRFSSEIPSPTETAASEQRTH